MKLGALQHQHLALVGLERGRDRVQEHLCTVTGQGCRTDGPQVTDVTDGLDSWQRVTDVTGRPDTYVTKVTR